MSTEKADFSLTEKLTHQRFNSPSVALGVLNFPLILRTMEYLIPFGNFMIKNVTKALIYVLCSTQKKNKTKTLNRHKYICV